MRGGHVLGHEGAGLRRAGERIGAHAEPAGAVAIGIVGPQLGVVVDDGLVDEDRAAGAFLLHDAHNTYMSDRDVAVVLSGGGMNGILLELGFLQGLRASELWSRVGWIYGTSAGALAGTMGAADRLGELEAFLLELQPDETFRPNRLWQTPLGGLHDYTLPATIAARIAPIEELAEIVTRSPIELVVIVTDVSPTDEADVPHAYEHAYSSRSTPPVEMAAAVLASAAISALVLPVRVGDVIGTDGGWVRNFPLAHAHANPAAQLVIGCRYLPRYPQSTADGIPRLRRRLERFRAVPPVRALIGELEDAEARQARGEPGHLAEMIVRLMRVAIARNTTLEERQAADRDTSMKELARLRADTAEIAARHARPGRRTAARRAVEDRFAEARFPFPNGRAVPTVVVHADAGDDALDPTFRAGFTWPLEKKLALIERGRRLAADALVRAEQAQNGHDLPGQA